MTTREVSRSWFAGSILVLCSGLVGLLACSPAESDNNNGGNGGGDECSGGRVLDDNGDCVCAEGEFNEDEERCITDGDGGSGGGGDEPEGGNGGSDEPAGGNGGSDEPAGGNGGSDEPAGGSGGQMMNTGGTMNMAGMPPASTFPCKANCKVMVVGDGLAAGAGSGANNADGAGFRASLRTALGSNFSTFVGMSGTPPHEGARMRKASDLLTAIPAMIQMHKPDLIVISIGLEEAFANQLNGLHTRIITVVDKAIELAPNAGVLVLGLPIWQNANYNNISKSSTDLARLVQERSTAGKKVRFVGLHGVLCNPGGCQNLPLASNFSSVKPFPSVTGYAALSKQINPSAVALMR